MQNYDGERSRKQEPADAQSESIYAKAMRMSEEKAVSKKPDPNCSLCKGKGYFTTVTAAGSGRFGYGMYSSICWNCAILTIGDPPSSTDLSTNII